MVDRFVNCSKSLKLNGLEVFPPTILSPMAGVTDPPFRRLVRELSAGRMGILVSEFVSTDGCGPEKLLDKPQAIFYPEERPFGIQIFGRDPGRMADAAEILATLKPDFIEVNAGCPVPKVADKGGGAGLLKDLPRLQAIIHEVKKRISIPLTLKCRLGWDENSINVFDTLKIAEDEGVEWLVVHGRTRVQGYMGFADWNMIGEVASRAKIPVVGNGDIVSAAGAVAAMEKYPVAGLSIGRGALHNPWLFAQISDAFEGKPVRTISAAEAMGTFKTYFNYMLEDGCPDYGALGRLKQLAARLCKGIFPDYPEFRQRLLTSETAEQFLERAERFCETEAEGRVFEPERLLNLNGLKTDEVTFGRQFKG